MASSDDDVFWTYENQRKSKRQSKQQQSKMYDDNSQNLPNQYYNHRDSLGFSNQQNGDHPFENSFLNETKNSPQFYVPPSYQDKSRAILGQLLGDDSMRNQSFQQQQHLKIETTKNIGNKQFMNLSTRSPKSTQNINTRGSNGQSFNRVAAADKENFHGGSRLIAENLMEKLMKSSQKQKKNGSPKYTRKGSSIWEDLYKELEKKKVIQQIKKEKEESEFDFKPKLKIPKKKTVPLLEIDASSSSFFERNEAWKDQRDNKLISKRQTQIWLDLKQCTFSPVVNKSKSTSKFFKNEQQQQEPQRISRALSSSPMASPQIKQYQQIHQQNTALINQLQQKEIDRLEKNNKELDKQLKISQAKLLMEAMKKEKDKLFQQEQSFGINYDGYYDHPMYEQLYRYN